MFVGEGGSQLIVAFVCTPDCLSGLTVALCRCVPCRPLHKEVMQDRVMFICDKEGVTLDADAFDLLAQVRDRACAAHQTHWVYTLGLALCKRGLCCMRLRLRVALLMWPFILWMHYVLNCACPPVVHQRG
mgnify:FL=1